MGRRDLLSAEERRRLFGVPVDPDTLARLYTFEPRDLDLIAARREERNRLGFAVQFALIRHPGLTLAQVAAQPGVDLEPLVDFIARQLQLPSTALADYLRASGESAPDNLLAHTSPVGWEHIAFSGDFLWDRAAALPTGRRDLTLARRVRRVA